ncbi:MAG: hypothetical protein O7H41_20795 [Planctomycetota bacterium]|nr:hypothetical protein [Planctomycetota bacterium]
MTDRGALSAIRNQGNTAALEGAVEHSLFQEPLARLLPQALVSLYFAVREQS